MRPLPKTAAFFLTAALLLGCKSDKNASSSSGTAATSAAQTAPPSSGGCRAQKACDLLPSGAVQSVFGKDPGPGTPQNTAGHENTTAMCTYEAQANGSPSMALTVVCSEDGAAPPLLAKHAAERVCGALQPKVPPTVVPVSGVGDAAFYTSCPSVLKTTAYGLYITKNNYMTSIQFTGTGIPDGQGDAVKLAKSVIEKL
ncbi:MAG TPA: hypothetical protein VGI39_15610 [Polyangiaceae bacterium]|jgi:hypothetical protein